MVQIEEDVREKVKSLLRELFQFDNQDLNFGIYRIMNFKRKEIEKFIEQDLIAEAERQFQEYSRAGQADLKNEVEQLRAEIVRDFGEGTLDSEGNVKKNEDAPKVKQYLDKKKLLEEAKVTQSQISDVFNHIYEFFSRYYDKGDFISKRRYGNREKYYVPYNGEEVLLYWANNDQYYVKSGQYFGKYSFKAGAYQVRFALRNADTEIDNVKSEPSYFVLADKDAVLLNEEKKELTVSFHWRPLRDEEKKQYGTRKAQDAVTSDIANHLLSEIGSIIREKSVLEKHLKRFVEKNTTDYFVHKNLKPFLERELDFYIKNEVIDFEESIDGKKFQLNKVKVHAIKAICQRVIEFVSQIEDFQKLLFEKKKFVTKTEFVITLDKLKDYCGEDFFNSIAEELVKNSQLLNEWKNLCGIEVKDKKDLVEKQLVHGVELKKLPIDTQYFNEEFKLNLLMRITAEKPLSEILDGVLMNGENLQALNLLLPKFKGQVKTIYIDPPFNTGGDDFLYKDEYQHSSWLSLMRDRLLNGGELLTNNGYFFVHIDNKENSRLKLLMDDIFGPENFRNEIVVKRIKKNVSEYETVKSLNTDQDIVLFYSKNPESRILPPTVRNGKKPRWHSFEASGYRTGMDYELFGFKPSPGNHWRWSLERAKIAISERRLRPNPNTGKPEYLVVKEEAVIGTIWDDIPAYSFNHKFSTEKSETLLKRIIEMTTTLNDLVVDFFAGSGTTLATAEKLRRKWVGVELGDFFDSILLNRMKSVLFGEKTGISKDVDWMGGGFFAYHHIERYEDTLDNIIFREKDKTIQETLHDFGDYFLRYMLDYETRESPTRLMIDKFATPFDYKIKTANEDREKTATVDLVETFNYLLGLTVEHLLHFKNQGRIYRAVFGKLENKKVAIIWRNSDQLNLEQDKEFIESKILASKSYDLIFINGDSYVRNARPVEPEFKRLMGA